MLFADCTIFRHVAASLAHEPDGCAVDRQGFTGADKARVWRGHEFFNVALSGYRAAAGVSAKFQIGTHAGSRRLKCASALADERGSGVSVWWIWLILVCLK